MHYMFEKGQYPESLELLDEQDFNNNQQANVHALKIGATYVWYCLPNENPSGFHPASKVLYVYYDGTVYDHPMDKQLAFECSCLNTWQEICNQAFCLWSDSETSVNVLMEIKNFRDEFLGRI